MSDSRPVVSFEAAGPPEADPDGDLALNVPHAEFARLEGEFRRRGLPAPVKGSDPVLKDRRDAIAAATAAERVRMEAERAAVAFDRDDEADDPELEPDPGPQPVRAAPPEIVRAPARAADRHPLAYTTQALDALQGAIDARERARFTAADPAAEFATLQTGTIGAPRVWGSNVLAGPRLLHRVAGVPTQRADAIYAQFPQLTLPTAQAASGETVTLTEYASSAAGSVTLARFGRWTDLTQESQIGADAGALTSMHQLGIALDMDKVLVDAVESAAGAAVAFNADVPGAVRACIATVLANTAAENPADLVILINPANAALLQDVTPTGGQTIAERFQRFSGAMVYPTTAADAGFATVANLRVGARYFEARALQTLTDVNVKTSVQTIATFVIAGYGLTLTAGAFVKQDIVTP